MDFPAANVRLGVSNLIREIERLNRSLKIPATLKEWGADLAEVRGLQKELVAAALADATYATNPRRASEEEMAALLKQITG